MSGMPEDTSDQSAVIRVLVVAPPPLRPDDLAGPGDGDVEIASIVRRPKDLGAAIDETEPDVVVVWTGYPDGHGIDAIGEARDLLYHLIVSNQPSSK